MCVVFKKGLYLKKKKKQKGIILRDGGSII